MKWRTLSQRPIFKFGHNGFCCGFVFGAAGSSGEVPGKILQNVLYKNALHISAQKTRASTRKTCPKGGPQNSHEKATEKPQRKTRNSNGGLLDCLCAGGRHEKATSKNVTSNEESSDLQIGRADYSKITNLRLGLNQALCTS